MARFLPAKRFALTSRIVSIISGRLFESTLIQFISHAQTSVFVSSIAAVLEAYCFLSKYVPRYLAPPCSNAFETVSGVSDIASNLSNALPPAELRAKKILRGIQAQTYPVGENLMDSPWGWVSDFLPGLHKFESFSFFHSRTNHLFSLP